MRHSREPSSRANSAVSLLKRESYNLMLQMFRFAQLFAAKLKDCKESQRGKSKIQEERDYHSLQAVKKIIYLKR